MSQQKTLRIALYVLNERINTEHLKYTNAIEKDHEFRIAKQIRQKIGLLQKEACRMAERLSC